MSEQTNSALLNEFDDASVELDQVGYRNSIKAREGYEKARAAVYARMKSEWKDIATAPKDGTTILIYRADVDRVMESRWDSEWQCWWPGSGLFHPKHATHWMPLPAPPAEARKS